MPKNYEHLDDNIRNIWCQKIRNLSCENYGLQAVKMANIEPQINFKLSYCVFCNIRCAVHHLEGRLKRFPLQQRFLIPVLLVFLQLLNQTLYTGATTLNVAGLMAWILIVFLDILKTYDNNKTNYFSSSTNFLLYSLVLKQIEIYHQDITTYLLPTNILFTRTLIDNYNWSSFDSVWSTRFF